MVLAATRSVDNWASGEEAERSWQLKCCQWQRAWREEAVLRFTSVWGFTRPQDGFLMGRKLAQTEHNKESWDYQQTPLMGTTGDQQGTSPLHHETECLCLALFSKSRNRSLLNYSQTHTGVVGEKDRMLYMMCKGRKETLERHAFWLLRMIYTHHSLSRPLIMTWAFIHL